MIPAKIVEVINRFATGPRLPDITFLLDMDAVEAHKRISNRRTGDPDRMEEQPAEFYEAVRRGYLDLGVKLSRQVRLDASSRKRYGEIRKRFAFMPFSKEAALERLNDARRAGRLAHAYLLTGPVGSGKSWLAERWRPCSWSVHRNG